MRHTLRLIVLSVFTLSAASCGGCASKAEVDFCAAVERGDAAAARSLLATGGFNVLARTFSGQCQPMMLAFDAAKPQSPEMTALALEILKQPGTADVYWTIPNRGGRSGRSGTGTPLKSAVRNGNAPLVQAIIAAGVDVTDTQGREALTDAVYQQSLEIVRMMVEAGSDPSAALRTAIVTRQHEIIAYAESKGGRETGPAAQVAARTGDLPALETAIARGDSLEVQDVEGLTPIMRAAAFAHPDAVARLAKAGANVNQMVEGKTALHYAAEAGDAATIQILAATKANLEARPDDNWPTPLVWAVTQRSAAGVHALVLAGAKGHVFKVGDKSALTHALEGGRLDMVRDLLAAGARPNDPLGDGWQPPLHLALPHCGKLRGEGDDYDYHVDLLRTLVAAGADRSAKNAAGLTAAETASRLLADATHPYYKQCFGAKVAYFGSLK